MLTAIAIDDEPKALEIIEIHAAKLPFLDLKRSFRDGLEAIAWLQRNPVDLVFLDINLPDLSGLRFRQFLGEQTMIVFTTAYSEYAVESYEQGAMDYLVKPIRFERFMKAVLRAGQQRGLKPEAAVLPDPAVAGEGPSRSSVYVKSGVKLIRLKTEDILFLKKDGNYVCFHIADGKRILSRLSTAQALDLLPPGLFFQVHKSFIVALGHIREIARQHVVIGKEDIPVAKERWKELLEKLGGG